MRLFSFDGYGLALAALALVVFGAIQCPPCSELTFEWITGWPLPRVEWLLDGVPVTSSIRHRILVDGRIHTLLVTNATAADAGRYTARATNTHGTSSCMSYVTVQQSGYYGAHRGGHDHQAMFVTRPPKDVRVNDGDDITLSFRVTGDPKPQGKMRFLDAHISYLR